MRVFEVKIHFKGEYQNVRVLRAIDDLYARDEAINLEKRISEQAGSTLEVNFCEVRFICETEN